MDGFPFLSFLPRPPPHSRTHPSIARPTWLLQCLDCQWLSSVNATYELAAFFHCPHLLPFPFCSGALWSKPWLCMAKFFPRLVGLIFIPKALPATFRWRWTEKKATWHLLLIKDILVLRRSFVAENGTEGANWKLAYLIRLWMMGLKKGENCCWYHQSSARNSCLWKEGVYNQLLPLI